MILLKCIKLTTKINKNNCEARSVANLSCPSGSQVPSGLKLNLVNRETQQESKENGLRGFLPRCPPPGPLELLCPLTEGHCSLHVASITHIPGNSFHILANSPSPGALGCRADSSYMKRYTHSLLSGERKERGKK